MSSASAITQAEPDPFPPATGRASTAREGERLAPDSTRASPKLFSSTRLKPLSARRSSARTSPRFRVSSRALSAVKPSGSCSESVPTVIFSEVRLIFPPVAPTRASPLTVPFRNRLGPERERVPAPAPVTVPDDEMV